MTAPGSSLAPGEVVDGKYRIVRELGRGAMGVVYVAEHATLGRYFALKTLRQELGGDADLAARFEQEARAASAIGHANIIDVFDLGRTAGGHIYMVMELLDGRPLHEILAETPRLPASCVGRARRRERRGRPSRRRAGSPRE